MTKTNDQFLLGIILLTAAVFSYTTGDTIYKFLANEYIVVQILFFRGFFGILLSIPILHVRKEGYLVKKEHFGLHLLRASIMITSIGFTILALKELPIADFTIISFSYAFFLAILSSVFFGEHIGKHRMVAITLGMFGVLLVIQPTSASFSVGGIYAIISSILWAMTAIASKKLTQVESPEKCGFYYSIFMFLFAVGFMPFYYVTPSLFDLGIFVALTTSGTFTNIIYLYSLRYVPLAVAGYFDYTALIWATLYGYFIWNELPTYLSWISAAIIIGSGIWLIYRETLHNESHEGKEAL